MKLVSFNLVYGFVHWVIDQRQFRVRPFLYYFSVCVLRRGRRGQEELKGGKESCAVKKVP